MKLSSHERQWLAVGFTLLLASVALILAHEEEPGVVVTPVRAEKFPDLPGHAASAVTVHYAPGARSSAHHHPGSVLAYVLTGAIRSENSATGPARVYQTGQSLFEPPGSRHLISENASQTDPASRVRALPARLHPSSRSAASRHWATPCRAGHPSNRSGNPGSRAQ